MKIISPVLVFLMALTFFLLVGAGGFIAEVRFGVPTVTRIAITGVLLCASLFVILSKRYSAQEKHWAYTTVGTILGFWLPK